MKNPKTYRHVATVQPSENYEINTLPSQTVPDQSMSIRTIIARFTNGLQAPVTRDLFFSEDNEDLRGLDITEIFELRRENQQEINALENAIKYHEAQELSKSEEKKLEKLKKEWVAEFQPTKVEML